VNRQLRKLTLWLGIASGVLAPVLYYLFGFSFVIVLLWLFGMFGTAAGLTGSRLKFWDRFELKDSYAVYFLLLIFVPAYFLYLYSVPAQMNTDELVIMSYQKVYAHAKDIFGISDYFGFPSFIFIVTGFIAKLMGGVGILHSRIIHASFGLLIIALAYLFFRQFWKTMPAFLASAVLGASHSLWAISRMAMRDNTALLAELLALPFLFFGLKNKNYRLTLVGGALAGLTYYVYQPGRIFIFVWLGFLFGLGLFLHRKYSWKLLGKLAAVTLLGFYFCALPIMVAEHKTPNAEAVEFSKERFLFLPEGRQLQQDWVSAGSVGEAVWTNIKNGLGTFNNKVHDQGYIYPNYGHGFVDPLGGIFLWVGVLALLYKLFRRTVTEDELLALFGFLSLWLAFAFLINKSPNYTRLLIILPFYVYLVVYGLIASGNWLMRLLLKIKIRHARAIPIPFMLIGVVWIVILNCMILFDFVNAGLDRGDAAGATARYIEHRGDAAGYGFILASDENSMYYSWGGPGEWTQWLGVSAANGQNVAVVDPDELEGKLPADGQFTVFMTGDVWYDHMDYIKQTYGNVRVTDITTDGYLVAVEVSADASPPVD
jgi:4-amino-4-deoxy-L-arabinose transferase-like glycosyltransferase